MRTYFTGYKGSNGIKMTTAKLHTNLDKVIINRLNRYAENMLSKDFLSYIVYNNSGSNSIYYCEPDSDKTFKKVNKPEWIKLIKDFEERRPELFAKAELTRK